MTMENASFDLYDLPENCIANVLSLTSPGDVCRLSSVSSTFRSAGDSSAVWCRFLPPEYQSIIVRSADASHLVGLPLKELYISLCRNPILIDEGSKSFWLDRLTGKKCYMLSARTLKITWGDTPRYWQWTSISDPRSRFSEVARLQDVCWLEITGKIDLKALSPSTNYAAYFVFSLDRSAYGFENQPVEVAVGPAAGGESITRIVYLDVQRRKKLRYFRGPFTGPFVLFAGTPRRVGGSGGGLKCRKNRSDGWWEVEIGEFEGGQEGELEMRVKEINGGHWKRGLIVCGIEIRPKMLP
ncbi:hypothetical protein SAY87_020020 [Trapa incisa]|uniref:F-box domain-containing protein n=1 Tax=Trapa incisa TaxID=236973 RepID=A0AAN7Q3W6_9MYRT|nr:hypothetical protein SAY87_020020 [Trapa incisa]